VIRKEIRMRLQLVTVLSILLAATAAHAQSVTSSATCDLPHASGVSMQQLTSGQRQRSYRLFVPPGYDGHARLSLVLDLHGSGGNAAGQARNSGLEALSANERFIVATLEAEGGRWNVPVQDGRADDVAYVSDVISHVAALREGGEWLDGLLSNLDENRTHLANLLKERLPAVRHVPA